MSDSSVHLECSGGWGPITQTAQVDLAQLPAKEMIEMESLLQSLDFDALKTTTSQGSNAAMRDGRTFKLEVRREGKRRLFEFGDRSIPPALVPLVQMVAKRLKATSPK